jgi:hypothetical protein
LQKIETDYVEVSKKYACTKVAQALRELGPPSSNPSSNGESSMNTEDGNEDQLNLFRPEELNSLLLQVDDVSDIVFRSL